MSTNCKKVNVFFDFLDLEYLIDELAVGIDEHKKNQAYTKDFDGNELTFKYKQKCNNFIKPNGKKCKVDFGILISYKNKEIRIVS